MLLLDFAFGLLLLRPIHPEHVSGDFAGVGPRWTSRPSVQGLVAVQHDADVLRLVFVPGGVGISEAQLATKRFDVIGFPGQEQPARDKDKTKHIGVVLYGNEALDRWAACPAGTDASEIARYVLWMDGPKKN